VFFVASDLEAAGTFFSRMFDPTLAGAGFELLLIPVTAFGLLLNFVGADLRNHFIRISDQLRPTPRLVLWLFAFVVVTSLRPLGVLPNAYFQF
jgi:hypothetical protein